MAAVNRTLGPPWNIWADQGDTLMFRDFAWVQLYCDSNQDVADTTLLAFRLAEDRRILLPVMVCMDAFIVSHTAMEVELATQEQVDRFLPACEVPHRLDAGHPVTVGGMAMPAETLSQRLELDEAMRRVPGVYDEHRARFREVFGREVSGAVESWRTEDADRILIASGTIATTLRDVVDAWRERGENVGMVRIKMFRPFPMEQIRELCSGAARVGVLDRNYAAGTGGIFWHEVRAGLQGRDAPFVQGYLTGVGGGDVVPAMIDEVTDHAGARPGRGALLPRDPCVLRDRDGRRLSDDQLRRAGHRLDLRLVAGLRQRRGSGQRPEPEHGGAAVTRDLLGRGRRHLRHRHGHPVRGGRAEREPDLHLLRQRDLRQHRRPAQFGDARRGPHHDDPARQGGVEEGHHRDHGGASHSLCGHAFHCPPR
jgi:pyruvate/2-oxoacid:ferredoxin oxidoreductase alpha subunit